MGAFRVVCGEQNSLDLANPSNLRGEGLDMRSLNSRRRIRLSAALNCFHRLHSGAVAGFSQGLANSVMPLRSLRQQPQALVSTATGRLRHLLSVT